ncbi:MAG: BamA/TamA family outer membrane protein [Paludibacter sp.]|nr:BamA/TamA family outer membrane protein [Bacteroidales bacterium]MCM1069275.1 BamA/TamA family outer membrane protein [Prevotella sp.]MCM1353742.1 BamA/TamA family outer membrane protein [Bacteroides sp.]MCM1442190.1 BamA/TamA family outer membrane protein [Muribaculum sp.]MCM1482152.1 BamA/TamA family outer membrane protein [Paludibacter sp.]
MRNCTRFILLGILVGLTACQTTKFVPEGKYLLNKAKVRVEDTKDVSSDNLKTYLRQTPNTEIFGFWKLQLDVYNSAGRDTTKWINRQLMKIGEPPEVFSEEQTVSSMQQLQRAMENMGYFNAEVDTTMKVKKRKVDLTYNIKAGPPYLLRNYKVRIEQPDLYAIATNRFSEIKEGMLFDTDKMETERQRITTRMRHKGYYYFEKDYLQYIADSAFRSNEVDVMLYLQDYIVNAPDSVQAQLFTRFKIASVTFRTEYDRTKFTEADVVVENHNDYAFVYAGKPMLRQRTLIKNCPIVPGDYYDERNVERTYAALNALGPVKYVSVGFEQVGADELACTVVLSRDKTHSVTAEVEGTYSAGDWGVAAGVGYTNRNIFRGAEEFSVNGRGSYEWRQTGGRAIEAKAEAALKFPNSTKISVSYNYQNRPEEYTRTIANAGVQYSLVGKNNRLKHYFNIVDVSYVYLPWISQEFSDYFLQSSNLLRYSYEDHFIVDWAYAGSYSSYRASQPLRNYCTLQYSVETAGNLLYGLSNLFHMPKDEDGAYRLFNIRYAQYAKADANFTYHQIFNKQHRLVWHAGLGVAVPFGNASSIPFEKRYFAGGANSVRGWSIRSLGPGGYRGSGSRIDYNNQAGDIKLDLNLEYRVKLVWVLELALFTDAGNIWTIRDYETQPHGQFRFDEFYKQIAWSYGIGLRLDFSFFVFRVDFGVKLYDPSRIYTDGRQWRTAPNGLGWNDDMVFHFAIGYPF